MRTTIACERKSKVKCIHDGTSPCQGCEKAKLTETCVLQGPFANRPPGESLVKSKRKPTPLAGTGEERRRKIPRFESSTVSEFFSSVPTGLINEAVSILRLKFPEYGFIQPPSLEPKHDQPDIEKLRLLAILAVASRYMPNQSLEQSEQYAAFVRQDLLLHVASPPRLSIIQAFLVLALYEWGEGVGYRAWMFAGVAIRMAQCLVATRAEAFVSEAKDNAEDLRPSESENRTLWTCFVIDKLLSCGRQRPAMMHIDDISTHLPIAEREFAFDVESPQHVTFRELLDDPILSRSHGTIEYQYSIIVRGINIWAKIHSYIVNGGRRQQGQMDLDQYPWVPGSFWYNLEKELFRWRDEQEDRLKYPRAPVGAHAHFRHGEIFAYINLLYFLSVIFIRREWIPFLPAAGTGPSGPQDAPHFKTQAPDGWWDNNNQLMFDASVQITHLMRDLKRDNASLITPFSGLCVYTSAIMHLYLDAFPLMNLSNSQSAQEYARQNIETLEEFRGMWKISEGWCSVIEIAKSMYQRIKSDHSSFTGKTREDFLQLETAFNIMGPSKNNGTPTSTTISTESTPQCNNPVTPNVVPPTRNTMVSYSGTQPYNNAWDGVNGNQPYSGIPSATFDLLQNIDSDSWRVWSFWDDPNLVPFDNSPIDFVAEPLLDGLRR
ncbi:uncharacterized protein BDZ99DRAFT_518363 [Mytilinidion resinicola]|uniref:Xylanolytic transcriptional activator regulatory domain-containing protein n=1 Tax=Mytilinidion resinicola TaxID=574789 RepID=A0A6A6YUC2_9PEZI|nr:uncharacterized protein BDZ99DRAFT_518363 [Mytilinidion resinicola]KAF2812532.1 hypothetical protein BDZ99DRAFT_518363 [Mytilinidion resinicola]